MSGHSEKRRRGGGRAGNAKRRSASKINQMPWHLPVNCDPPISPLTDQGVEAIHEGAMRILEEIGIDNDTILRMEDREKQNHEMLKAMMQVNDDQK